MPSFADKVEFDDVVVKVETKAAILCLIDGRDVWIPQSCVDDDSECWRGGDRGTLVVSEFIAKQKGLI